MSENNHSRRNVGGKGYYIALILCAAAIGITGYVYHRNTTQTEQVIAREEENIPVGTMEMEINVPALATEPQSSTEQTSEPSQPTQPARQPGTKRKLQTQSPVSGQEIFGYSMEALSYNETRDWRVHNGVDIAAEEGTPVCAAADGTVSAVYEDDTMGCTVVINHEGGYATFYSSLGQDTAVNVGDAVTMGQTIGTVGSTALVETTLGSHLHFSVTCQNQSMDPAEFMALGK